MVAWERRSKQSQSGASRELDSSPKQEARSKDQAEGAKRGKGDVDAKDSAAE